MINDNIKLGIIGLGYVGLPLAVAFSSVREVVAYDINAMRIKQLKNNIDISGEVPKEVLATCNNIQYTNISDDLANCNVYIVTVPTPVLKDNNPDFNPLISASTTISKLLKLNDIVIYESTVYPGATEEVCVPILESHSNLKFISKSNSQDAGFYCGYSPERINPGDKSRTITDIIKITSGSTNECLEIVDNLYSEIITAGTYKVDSIRIAEAAKVIENIQRDVNIALINEIAIILKELGIDTEKTLKAAETKWNFISFRPGLVGGHCIGIDPYYLKYKAQSHGIYPEIISSVRRLNDAMPAYAAFQLIKTMLKNNINVSKAKVLILGLTFKENCPDIRNSKCFDLISEIKEFGCDVDVYDPTLPSIDEIKSKGLNILKDPPKNAYDAIVLAVKHKEFTYLSANEIRLYGKELHVFYDLKYSFSAEESDLRL